MKISLSINSAQAQAQLRRWGGEFKKDVRAAVSKVRRSQVLQVQAAVQEGHWCGSLQTWDRCADCVTGAACQTSFKAERCNKYFEGIAKAARGDSEGAGGYPLTPILRKFYSRSIVTKQFLAEDLP